MKINKALASPAISLIVFLSPLPLSEGAHKAFVADWLPGSLDLWDWGRNALTVCSDAAQAWLCCNPDPVHVESCTFLNLPCHRGILTVPPSAASQSVKEKIWHLLPARVCCLISIPCNLKLEDITRKMFIPRKEVYLATGAQLCTSYSWRPHQTCARRERGGGCPGKWTTQTAEGTTIPKPDSRPFVLCKCPYPTHSSMQSLGCSNSRLHLFLVLFLFLSM